MNVVLALAALYAAIMSALGIDRYITYHSGADLGEFVQTTASAFSTFGDTPEGGSHFLHHFSPILYLCVPIVLLSHSAIALVVIQAIAGAATAPAIYLIARKRVDERLARTIAAVALLYPPLVGVTFTDFHEDGFAPAFLAWLVWAVDGRRFKLAAILFVLALGIKEDEGIFLAVLACGYAIVRARARDGLAVRYAGVAAVVALGVVASYFTIVRPLAGAHDRWFALDYYVGHQADAPHGAAIVLGRVSYLLEAFVPLAFVPLATPWIVLAVPGFVEVLGSRWPLTYTMGQHYAAVWSAYALVAFTIAIGHIYARRPERARTLVTTALALCALDLAVASPTHWGHYLRPYDAHDAALDRMVASLPADASVGTIDEIYSHLGFDPGARIGIDTMPTYALFDARYDGAPWREIYRPALDRFVKIGTYVALRSDDGVTLYRRRDARI